VIAIVALMMMELLPLLMCRHCYCCQDGVITLVTMAPLPFICNGIVALVMMVLFLSSSWRHHPHCNVVVIINVLALNAHCHQLIWSWGRQAMAMAGEATCHG
jgi:hypothetical protein